MAKTEESSTMSDAQVEDASDEETESKTKMSDRDATSIDSLIDSISAKPVEPSTSVFPSTSTSLVLHDGVATSTALALPTHTGFATDLIMRQRKAKQRVPEWHAPYKLKRVIAGHQGWVRAVSVDTSNEWFATGSSDRTIKIWDLASGILKVTLTGHASTVRGLDISARHPYLFSASEDKDAKCWDLEHNQATRTFHGHTSGVVCVKVHPTLDLVMTGSKDRTCRVWDMRSRTCVRVLHGHQHTVAAVDTQPTDPQVLTASQDGTIRLWDLVSGRSLTTLTHHKKSVRAIAVSPTENSFASASSDSVRTWKLPEGIFMRRMQHTPEIVNSLAINRQGVMAAAGDAGTLALYDYKTGYQFQSVMTPPQPGSLDSERGIFSCAFDMTGSRLITGEADKSIKIYAEDPDATPATFPLTFNPFEKW